MSEQYDHKKIEKKWQKHWEETGAFFAKDDSTKEKEYLLIEFPYPSGDGLHVGHVRSWTALDVVARKHRTQGKEVLYPIGWDAFGLPAENFALKTGIHPKILTKKNTDNFKRQIKAIGLSFDWSREIDTTDPAYYKWTQWIFLQLFKKGLAYKAKAVINWCPKDKVGLANEEVVDGECERCGTQVEKREKEQWMLAITKYAQRLYDDLDTVDYIERAKVQQRNWIGPSEGAEIEFTVEGQQEKITVFTTRPDTIFGATYLVLAPEHALAQELAEKAENKDEVLRYIVVAKKKTEIERTTDSKEKTGVELKGVKAINPANEEEIPVFVADYVLGGYGTGAIMAVPAHDERDFAFAKKFDLPIKKVIVSEEGADFYVGSGALINSAQFDGLESEEAKPKITEFVGGKWVTTFKLRDWVFSRQRYWGEPIPMIHCGACGWQPVPEQDLPVLLPDVEQYRPGENGESPLAGMPEWFNTTCPKCQGPAKRETDVMPQWAGSSWYYLRYCDPKNETAFADQAKLAHWTPVDWYNGGMEHTTLHLLYSRFWHKFLFDIGVVPSAEPYKRRTSHGLILAEDGSKMSKSKGNTVSPDVLVESFGADSLRLYEMFIGPFDQPTPWNSNSVVGVRRFLERVWKLSLQPLAEKSSDEALEVVMHTTAKKVSEDIEAMKFNTAVSQLMICLNAMEKAEGLRADQWQVFLRLLAPFAPHITSELWEKLGFEGDVSLQEWPHYDPSKLTASHVLVAVQINGKTRATIELAADSTEETALSVARADDTVAKWLTDEKMGREVRAVYVPGKIINFVVAKS